MMQRSLSRCMLQDWGFMGPDSGILGCTQFELQTLYNWNIFFNKSEKVVPFWSSTWKNWLSWWRTNLGSPMKYVVFAVFCRLLFQDRPMLNNIYIWYLKYVNIYDPYASPVFEIISFFSTKIFQKQKVYCNHWCPSHLGWSEVLIQSHIHLWWVYLQRKKILKYTLWRFSSSLCNWCWYDCIESGWHC